MDEYDLGVSITVLGDDEAEVRTIGLGNVGNAITILVQFTEGDDGEVLSIVTDGPVRDAESVAELSQLFKDLSEMLSDPEVDTAWREKFVGVPDGV